MMPRAPNVLCSWQWHLRISIPQTNSCAQPPRCCHRSLRFTQHSSLVSPRDLHAVIALLNIHIQSELQCHLQGAQELGKEARRQALVVAPLKCQMSQPLQPRNGFARAIQMPSEVSGPEAWYASIVLQRLQRSWQAKSQLAANTVEAC